MTLHERGYRFRAVIISAVLAAGAFVALAFWSDAARFGEALRRVGAAELAALLALSVANYATRAARWRVFLSSAGHPLGWAAATANYVRGFAWTTTPGKVGEAARALELKRDHAVPYAVSIAALLADRLSDVLGLALISILALAFIPNGGVVAACVAAGVALVLWIAASDHRTAALVRLLVRVVPHRFAARLEALAREASRLARGGPLTIGLALSVAGWAAEAWALYLVVASMGATMPVETAMGIYAIALLGGALFLLPGGLGSTEALMLFLLVRAGMEPAAAGAATVVSRVTTLWFAVALGWTALAWRGAKRQPG